MVFQEEVKGLAVQNRPKSCKIFFSFAIMGEKLLFNMGATIEQTKKYKPKKEIGSFPQFAVTVFKRSPQRIIHLLYRNQSGEDLTGFDP